MHSRGSGQCSKRGSREAYLRASDPIKYWRDRARCCIGVDSAYGIESHAFLRAQCGWCRLEGGQPLIDQGHDSKTTHYVWQFKETLASTRLVFGSVRHSSVCNVRDRGMMKGLPAGGVRCRVHRQPATFDSNTGRLRWTSHSALAHSRYPQKEVEIDWIRSSTWGVSVCRRRSLILFSVSLIGNRHRGQDQTSLTGVCEVLKTQQTRGSDETDL